jgi:hypothetical protein
MYKMSDPSRGQTKNLYPFSQDCTLARINTASYGIYIYVKFVYSVARNLIKAARYPGKYKKAYESSCR